MITEQATPERAIWAAADSWHSKIELAAVRLKAAGQRRDQAQSAIAPALQLAREAAKESLAGTDKANDRNAVEALIQPTKDAFHAILQPFNDECNKYAREFEALQEAARQELLKAVREALSKYAALSQPELPPGDCTAVAVAARPPQPPGDAATVVVVAQPPKTIEEEAPNAEFKRRQNDALLALIPTPEQQALLYRQNSTRDFIAKLVAQVLKTREVTLGHTWKTDAVFAAQVELALSLFRRKGWTIKESHTDFDGDILNFRFPGEMTL